MFFLFATNMKFLIVILVCVTILHQLHEVYSGRKFVSNLSAVCLRCLCHAATTCNMTIGCQNDFCGPFFLPKQYWREAQRPVLKNDDPDRTNAFIDCAQDYACASEIVVNYMAKYGYDCNNDAVTDCDDYARLLFHGKDRCSNTISNLNFGKRYATCKPVTNFPNN